METFSDSTGIRGSVESLIGGRKENQDSYGMAETRLGMLVAVCDGMGGGPAGKTASSIATQAILDYVSGADTDKNPASVLSDAVTAANEAVLAAVAQNPSLKGMGTTCVCVLITDREAYVVHVGDSRFYQLRGSKAIFRTADHSYVGEMVRHGTLTEEEARNSQYSNVITRAIGVAHQVDPEVDIIDYKPGDRFALMTDGIWGTLPEPQLVKFLSKPENPAIIVPEIASNIDALGHDNGGGHDNLTLAIIDTPRGRETTQPLPPVEEAIKPTRIERPTAQKPKATPAKDAPKKKPKFSPQFIAISVIVVIGLVIAAFFIGRGGTENENENDSTKNAAKEQKQDFADDIEAIEGPQPTMTPKISHKENRQAPTSGEATIEDVSKIVEKKKVNSGQENTYFDQAIKDLEALKNYDPNGQGRKEVEKARAELRAKIFGEVQEGIENTTNEEKRNLAIKILKEMKLNQNKLTMIESGKNISTAEANQFIDKYEDLLKKVINK